MTTENLCPQQEWDSKYEAFELRKPNFLNTLALFIRKQFKKIAAPSKSVLEIGCFPGGYLSVFGDLGFKVSGFDLTPRISQLREWMLRHDYQVGAMDCEDFFSADTKKYAADVVCSLGFIEHFPDWKPVLRRHIEFLKPGGTLFLEAPNFRGKIQKFLHSRFDSESMARHCLEAMDPLEWAEEARRAGLIVDKVGWIGGFNFWSEKPNPTLLTKGLILALGVSRVFGRLLPNHPAWSTYAVLVAHKPN